MPGTLKRQEYYSNVKTFPRDRVWLVHTYSYLVSSSRESYINLDNIKLQR